MHYPALDACLVASLALLGAGIILKGRACHPLRAGGWALFGIYWAAQFPYWLAKDETINMLGTGAALPLFLYIAYHEFRSWKWDDEYEPLRYLAAACFAATLPYFVVEAVPAFSAAVVWAVSAQTTWLINALTGAGYSIASVSLNGNPPFYHANDSEVTAYFIHSGIASRVSVILPCTALQAILAAFAFIAAAPSTRKNRARALLVVVPSIYIINLFRNAFVIYATDFQIFGAGTFDLAHGIIGKIVISMTALVVLMVVAFLMVPEFYDCINGAFELPWRNAPGHDYKGNIGRLLGGKGRDSSGKGEKGGPKTGAGTESGDGGISGEPGSPDEKA